MRKSFYDHDKLVKLRESLGMSKQDLADALGVTLMTVYRIERGGCSIELLAKAAIILGVPLAVLMLPAERIVKNFSTVINI